MKRLLLAAFVVALPAGAQAPAPDRVARLLGELADAPGPPGFEEPVRRIVVREVKPLADRLTYDGLGSVIATQGGGGPTVMLDAHMDELAASSGASRPRASCRCRCSAAGSTRRCPTSAG